MNLNKVKQLRAVGITEHGNVIVDALDYSQLRQSFPDNFYLVLASRVAPILKDKKKLKSDQTQTEFKVLGNDVKFSYPKLSIYINGTKVPASSTDGMKWFKDIIYNAIQMETNNSLSISRPEGRTLPKDRSDFNKTDISMFKQLFKSTTVNEDHTKNLDVQGARGASKKRFLTQEQFDKYQPEGFTKYSNTSGDYYVKTGVNVIDITPENLNKAMHMLNMPNGNNRQAEYLARGPLGDLLTNHDETNPFTVVVSGQEAFLVEHNSSGDFKVQNINVSNNKVSEVMKNYKGAKEVDPVAIEYKNWLSENKLKPSEKNFNKFKDLPEFKHLFDSCTFTSRNYHQHILDTIITDSSHINTKYTDEQLKDLLSTYLRNEGVPVTKSFDVGGDDETIVVTGVRRGLIPVVSDFIEAKGFEYLGYNGDRDSSLYSVLFSRRVMDSDSADGDSSTTA